MTVPLHRPVMLERVTALLAPALAHPSAVQVDATLGLGGHAEAILERCPAARLIGLDRDPEALAQAGQRLARFGPRVRLVRAVFDQLPEVLAEEGLAEVSGVLFDLGLSSLQIDDRRRGFAYAVDAPLDMRMDGLQSSGPSAADLVNSLSQAELTRLLKDNADERFAARIAAAIVTARAHQPFANSARLVQVVEQAIPVAARHGGHPAKRTFQALRMAVNQERESLSAALPAALNALAVGGRIVCLSYHSGEDRPVKRALAAASRDQAPDQLVAVPEHLKARFRLLTHGAERPGAEELAANPRSASARLRAAERIRPRIHPQETA